MLSVKSPNVFSESESSKVLTVSLLDLPVEVFLHICSFLDAATLVHGLGCVCKQFYEILCDDSLWKHRIGQIWQNARYPVLPPDEDDELFWKQSCVKIEKHVAYWSDKSAIEKISLKEGHFSPVDTVMLVDNGRLSISGGRDRMLCCWSPHAAGNSLQLNSCKNQRAHGGWIWGLTAVDKTVYSCSWDKTVKSWNISFLHIAPINTFEMDVVGALLCITSNPSVNILATGSHCRTVILFDPRIGAAPIVKYRTHRGAVLKVAMDENYVLSASEDKTVGVWDQRAGKSFKTVEISKYSFPMSMVMDKGAVHVGDSSGNLHLLNPKQNFEIVKSYASGHTKGVNCLCSTAGGLITGSLDKTVRLLSPTDPPQLITSLDGSVGEIASMDYLNDVLVICGSYVELWRPRRSSHMENVVYC